MSIDLKVPSVGESVTEVIIGEWLVQEGQYVDEDTPVVVVESDKVNLEVPAPKSGVLAEVLKGAGETATVGEIIARLEPGERPAATAAPTKGEGPGPGSSESDSKVVEARVTPAARRLLAESSLVASDVEATGPGGRLLKEDVLRHLEAKRAQPAAPAKSAPKPVATPPAPQAGDRAEERVRMSPLRRTVARRLVEAQQAAALLTTFNEIDMSAVMELRKVHRDAFIGRYDIKLGFMSFFVKAVVDALKQFPAVNARIEGEEVVYHHYFDIGVAVGGGRGLVVPIIRNAERLGFAEVEQTIADLGQRARDNKLKLAELTGGTFSITNGGVYGSLLSTPIVNPPQSGILGMHGIQERPVAVDGEVVIRPMMYVALTYDHRIVDGREAVTFLKRIKECVESPVRMLLEV